MKLKSKIALGVALTLLVAVGAVVLFVPRVLALLYHGEVRTLRPDGPDDVRADPSRPKLLILAIDGVDRTLLYDMLRAGELPHLAALLGNSSGAGFSNACFYDHLVTVLPSTTLAAWTTVFTGADPGSHGITGNELFDRSTRSLIAPAPVSVDDVSPVFAIYTDDALGRLLDVPTLYERLRESEPHLRIWVAMSQIYGGADRLLLARRTVVAGAFAAFLSKELGQASKRDVYSDLDEEVLDTLDLRERWHVLRLETARALRGRCAAGGRRFPSCKRRGRCSRWDEGHARHGAGTEPRRGRRAVPGADARGRPRAASGLFEGASTDELRRVCVAPARPRHRAPRGSRRGCAPTGSEWRRTSDRGPLLLRFALPLLAW